jgi:hypothetical protein
MTALSTCEHSECVRKQTEQSYLWLHVLETLFYTWSFVDLHACIYSHWNMEELSSLYWVDLFFFPDQMFWTIFRMLLSIDQFVKLCWIRAFSMELETIFERKSFTGHFCSEVDAATSFSILRSIRDNVWRDVSASSSEVFLFDHDNTWIGQKQNKHQCTYIQYIFVNFQMLHSTIYLRQRCSWATQNRFKCKERRLGHLGIM